MSAPLNNNTATAPIGATNPAAGQPGFQQQGDLHHQQQPGQLNEHHGIAASGLNDHISPAAPVTGAPLVDAAGQQITGNNHKDHHLGRDTAAVGATGAGLAHHEHNKLHNDNGLTGHNNNLTGHNNGLTGNNNLTGHNNTHNDHHLGRDAAAVGATGAGLAHHEHNKHNDNGLTGHNNNLTGHNNGLTGHNNNLTGHNNTHNDHHLGRDAAAVGATGAGLAHHEHNKHHDNTLTGQNNNISGESHTLAGRTHIPGQENVEHKLNDPHHHTGSAFEGTRATLGATSEPAGAEKHHHLGNDHHNKEHHTGRDAALGAGAGAGLAHEANKHHDKHNTTGTSNPLHHDNKEHHTGRDAVATGGVAGLASHEKAKHDNERHAGVPQHDGLLPNKHDNKHTTPAGVEGETKPSATDKIKGNLEKVVGKVTGNEAKVIKGENLAHGRAE
ncbi:unnamed protein product [Mucor hiemalis]